MPVQPDTVRASWRGYSLIHWFLALAAIVLIAIWWLSTVVSGFSAPNWVPSSGCLALVLALWIL